MTVLFWQILAGSGSRHSSAHPVRGTLLTNVNTDMADTNPGLAKFIKPLSLKGRAGTVGWLRWFAI